ncbi:MAG: diacylglycerol kinase family lipid kinase [Cellulomonas sp.]|nr:diacylglycerol kinase family lipid kinase [Cellulomonas sp.]
MSRIGLVVNPTAGHGRGQAAGGQAHAGLVAAGHTVTDLSAPTLVQATDAARAAAVSGLDALVVVGGDGMTHLGVNVVAGTDLPLGIVASGSGNDIARWLGLPVHDVPAALATVGRGLVDGPRLVDAAQVGAPGTEAFEWYVGVLSCGIDAAVNARANRMRFPPGMGKYLRALAAEIVGYRPYGYRLVHDGATEEFAGPLVAVANTGAVGGGIKIAPHARADDGQLDVLWAGKVGRGRVLALLPRLFTATHLRHPQVHTAAARRVLVAPSPDDGPAPPVAYADGERIGPLPLEVRLVPGALSLLG